MASSSMLLAGDGGRGGRLLGDNNIVFLGEGDSEPGDIGSRGSIIDTSRISTAGVDSRSRIAANDPRVLAGFCEVILVIDDCGWRDFWRIFLV